MNQHACDLQPPSPARAEASFDVFIWHCAKDQALASRLATLLWQQGFHCVLGSPVRGRLEKLAGALASSASCTIVHGPCTTAEDVVDLEQLTDTRRQGYVRLIPLRIGSAQVVTRTTYRSPSSEAPITLRSLEQAQDVHPLVARLRGAVGGVPATRAVPEAGPTGVGGGLISRALAHHEAFPYRSIREQVSRERPAPEPVRHHEPLHVEPRCADGIDALVEELHAAGWPARAWQYTVLCRVFDLVAELWGQWNHQDLLPYSARARALDTCSAAILQSLGTREAARAGDAPALRRTLHELMRSLQTELSGTLTPGPLASAIALRPQDEREDRGAARRHYLQTYVRRGRAFTPDEIASGLGLDSAEVAARSLFSDGELARLLGTSTTSFRSLLTNQPVASALNRLRQCTGYVDAGLSAIGDERRATVQPSTREQLGGTDHLNDVEESAYGW